MYVLSFLGKNILVFNYHLGLDFKHKASLINWMDRNFLREEKEEYSVMIKGLNISPSIQNCHAWYIHC